MPKHDHPENLRAYGVLLRGGRVLISAEYVGDVFCWKFPGVDPLFIKATIL